MPVITTSSADLELIDGATVVPLMLARPERSDGTIADGSLRIEEALVASGAGQPLSEWLEPMVVEDWFGGIGLAYDAAPGCDTFTAPGYVFPGGAATSVTLPATNNSGTPIVAIAEFNGDLFVAQRGDGTANTARVMRSVGKTAAFTNSLNLGANEYLKDLLVARASSSGSRYLWASSGSVTGADGRMHRWDGGAWMSTNGPNEPGADTFGTNGRNKMAAVFWEGTDGVGDWRIVALASNQGHISYTRPGGDPMVAADWIELVPVGDGTGIGELVAARRHIYLIDTKGKVFDLDEQGNSPLLTAYTQEDRANTAPVGAGIYFDGHVYHPLGNTLDRVRVDQGPVLQEHPGTCTPGWGTRAESQWLAGVVSATATWNGGLLVGMPNTLGRVGIFWGKPREVVGIETPNPLVWHGPFAIGPLGSEITRMYVTSSSATPSSTTLWAATWPFSQVDQPALTKISLPAAGGAMQDLKIGSGHRYANGAGSSTGWQEYSRVEGLATTAGDKGSKKFIHELTIGSRGLPTSSPGGTDPSMAVYVRADAAPTSSAWGTASSVTLGPTADVTPETTSGYKLENRIDLISPAGASTPPKPAILDSLRMTFWRTAPDLDTWTFEVEYGDGIYGIHNSHWPNQSRDVQWYTNALIAMAQGGRVVMRDRQDRRWSVKLKHYLPRRSDLHDGVYGRTTRATITVALLGAA